MTLLFIYKEPYAAPLKTLIFAETFLGLQYKMHIADRMSQCMHAAAY